MIELKSFQVLLYVAFGTICNGSGTFILGSPGPLPDIRSSGSVVTAADIDGDMRLELFVGGRVVPGQYPEPPQSYLLKNTGSK